MRVLIFGGAGMLGHKLAQRFAGSFETVATVRGDAGRFRELGCFEGVELLGDVDVATIALEPIIESVRPDVVVNAIGIIKQVDGGQDPEICRAINSELPVRLAAVCERFGVRFIAISTDCVFSGRRGRYSERDSPDADDLYGRSKLLGEIVRAPALTIRTSMIGRELSGVHGLLEWFLSNRGGRVKGFSKAVFSGFPTCELADILADVIRERPTLSGLYHVSSAPISKLELLKLVNAAFDARVDIEIDEDFVIDRSLDSTRFREETGFVPRTWEEMVESMALDSAAYDRWRS
jgi:dTDP-4-dehydrorhamnose reductase